MCDSQNEDSFGFDPVNYRVRELTNEPATEVVEQDLTSQWLRLDRSKGLRNTLKKDFSQSGVASFIESYRCFEFFVGIFVKSYFRHRNSSRASRRT